MRTKQPSGLVLRAGRHVDGPPRVVRSRAGAAPICPEGERFCGIPVWRGYASETLADRRVVQQSQQRLRSPRPMVQR